MPRPGPPPYCFAVAITFDSWIRLPTMPAACAVVRPFATKKLNAACSELERACSDMLASSSPVSPSSVAQPNSVAERVAKSRSEISYMSRRLSRHVPHDEKASPRENTATRTGNPTRSIGCSVFERAGLLGGRAQLIDVVHDRGEAELRRRDRCRPRVRRCGDRV